MNEDCNFYICSICFNTSEEPATCHNKMMLHCGSFQPGDADLKPLMDEDGDLKSSAPRWFLQYLERQDGRSLS